MGKFVDFNALQNILENSNVNCLGDLFVSLNEKVPLIEKDLDENPGDNIVEGWYLEELGNLNQTKRLFEEVSKSLWGIRIYPEGQDSFLLNPIYVSKELAKEDAECLRKKYSKVEVEKIALTSRHAFS